MRLTLVLVGPHGSGKTTVGQAAAAALGWPFHDEIGERLRREALRSDPAAHAMQDQRDFDRAVFERELWRDAAAPRRRVVETWHPGNLAYAERRSSDLASAFATRLRRAARSGVAVVQPLTPGVRASLDRLSEPGPSPEVLAAWFRSVGRRAGEIAGCPGPPPRPAALAPSR